MCTVFSVKNMLSKMINPEREQKQNVNINDKDLKDMDLEQNQNLFPFQLGKLEDLYRKLKEKIDLSKIKQLFTEISLKVKAKSQD